MSIKSEEDKEAVSNLLYLTTEAVEEDPEPKIETLKINSIIEEKKDEVPIEKKNSNVERIDDIQCNRLSTINPNGINAIYFEEEEKIGENIIMKESNNTIQYISIDLFLKKIILENFFNEQPRIVNGFLNQFCCFFHQNILIDKIINAFYFYEHKKVENDKLKNLITFLNSVVIEIIEQSKTSIEPIDKLTEIINDFYKKIGNEERFNAIGIKEILSLIEQSNPSSYDVEFTRNSLIPRKKSQNVMVRGSRSFSNFFKKKEKKKYFCILDWEDFDIANQLTFLSSIQLSVIQNREFLAAKFLKKEKKVTSPTVVKITQRFDSLILFVIEDILSYDHKPVRAKVIEKWIDIAEKCKLMNNYNDSMSIKSALNHYIVMKLKLTWKYVKKAYTKKLEELNEFFSCEGNYKFLREEIKTLKNVPFVPYLGILMRDIAFYEEKGKYIVNNNTMINVEKILTIQNLLDDFYKFKDSAYNIKQIEELSFFSCMITKNEEELEALGDKLEPEFTLSKIKQNEKRLTTIDTMFFCEDELTRSTRMKKNTIATKSHTII